MNNCANCFHGLLVPRKRKVLCTHHEKRVKRSEAETCVDYFLSGRKSEKAIRLRILIEERVRARELRGSN